MTAVTKVISLNSVVEGEEKVCLGFGKFQTPAEAIHHTDNQNQDPSHEHYFRNQVCTMTEVQMLWSIRRVQNSFGKYISDL